MTDQELRRLNRAELIDIIYELQLRREQQEEENRSLRQQLEDRLLHIQKAGSIAEAAIQVNQVIEAAQAAADQYLSSIHAANTDMDQRIAAAEQSIADARSQASAITAQANRQAEAIVRDAEVRAQAIVAEAERQASVRWDRFQKKAAELLRTQEELRKLVKRNDT